MERFVWRVIGRTRTGEMRWTDDTQMALDTAESLVSLGRLDPDDLAARFASSYRWSRGYGPGTAKLLKLVSRGASWAEASRSIYKDGSFGNGGAMRSPIIGLYFADSSDLLRSAFVSAAVTHAHPLGTEGAVLVALGVARLVRGDTAESLLGEAREVCRMPEFISRLSCAQSLLDKGGDVPAALIRKQLGNGIAAVNSCVTALYLALRFREAEFLELQRFVASLGGDVDTIGSMAGALWGAANGAERLPQSALSKLEQRARILTIAGALHARM